MAWQTPDTTILTVHLQDAAGQPLAGVRIELVLYRYGEEIRAEPGGVCTTDAAGSCVLLVMDPPRLPSGRAEGALFVEGFSFSQPVGWTGAQAALTVQVNDLEYAATLVAEDTHLVPHHDPYEDAPEETPAPPTETPARPRP